MNTHITEDLIKQNLELKKELFLIKNQKYRKKCTTQILSFADIMSNYICEHKYVLKK